MRGLKHQLPKLRTASSESHTDWVYELNQYDVLTLNQRVVTLLLEAWIETLTTDQKVLDLKSHHTWVSRLKLTRSYKAFLDTYTSSIKLGIPEYMSKVSLCLESGKNFLCMFTKHSE